MYRKLLLEVLKDYDKCKESFRTVVNLLLRLHPEYKGWINENFKEMLDEDSFDTTND